MNSNSDDFKALKKEWYGKLKDSGFVDAEQDEDNLKQWASSAFKHNFALLSDDRETYYRLAGHFLHDYEFDGAFEKYVWELHSQGMSYREISKYLKRIGCRGSFLRNIFLIVRRLRKVMLAKYVK